MSPLKSESLAGKTGKEYWRSLNQLAQSPEFEEFLHREFPVGASELTDPVSRRKFLGLMGASMALAGLVSCRRPVQKIVPYVIQPENVTPGIPKYYATTMPMGVSSYGLLVESHEGRPTKIEGNKKHPSTLGSVSSFMLAEIMRLYDPDRASTVMQKGNEKSWDDFLSFWRTQSAELSKIGGRGVAVLTESVNSPTFSRIAGDFKKKFPNATWAVYDSVNDERIYDGINTATGKRLAPVNAFGKAKVILSLDSDFLDQESESVSAIRGFADGRRVTSEKDSMNRLYTVESSFSVTGGAADHRLRLRSADVPAFAVALANELRVQGASLPNVSTQNGKQFDSKFVSALAKDLLANRGASLVVAGRKQPAELHSLVALINEALGNTGKTVSYQPLPAHTAPDRASFDTLVTRMKAGEITHLFIFGGNPVYDAPVGSGFADALSKVTHAVRFGMHADESAAKCEWFVPSSHFLESWGDCRAIDGTLSVTQPLIEPLYKTHNATEFLNFLTTGVDTSSYLLVRETWKEFIGGINFEKKWEVTLHDGLMADSARSPEKVSFNSSAVASRVNSLKAPQGEMELVFTTGATFDGRYANTGWLQEMPDSVTKLSWDNAAVVSHRAAKSLNVTNGDVVTISANGSQMEAPIWIVPGHSDESVTIALGYGRTQGGTIGTNVGVDAFPLRTNNGADYATGVTLAKTGRTYPLANTQDHGSMEGRAIVREGDLEEYKQNPDFVREMDVETPALNSLWSEHTYTEGYQWGMTIDLNTCIGCNACAVACQSENNVPIVGKEQVSKGREMHWLRMDRYFTGDVDNPQMVHQPMACQHCEMAPCEQVCPVAATVHDKEGLNVMVYNRCIGTRYCSNNCPYKVRRFNFFNYTKETPVTTQMAMNPDVTMRFRGVMEKCTYCVQRINRAKLNAKHENRQVQDGEVVTACQQACPANAIVFGNINDPNSEVSKIKARNRNYQVLPEINTRPRTSYSARLRNPNPELPATVNMG